MYPEAAAALQEAVRLDAKNYNADVQLGNSFDYLHRSADAIASYQRDQEAIASLKYKAVTGLDPNLAEKLLGQIPK